MKDNHAFARDVKLVSELSEKLTCKDLPKEDLRHLTEAFKKWHGFHTPHGIEIGCERRVAKMGQRSILLYQLWINTQLMVTDLRPPFETTMLMSLAHWQRFAIHTAIQEESPDKLTEILQCDPNHLLIKVNEETGEWWLLKKIQNLATQPV